MLKSLEECIEIGERLIEDDYVIYPDDVEEWRSTHNRFIDKMSEDIHKFLIEAYNDAEKRQCEDNEKFFDIMKKYHSDWWS